MKKFLLCFIASLIFCSGIVHRDVYATNSTNMDSEISQESSDSNAFANYHLLMDYLGCGEDDGIWQDAINNNRANRSTTNSYPASVDLSESGYFPNIQSQGSEGSCVPFSSVYYQFSYEVNRNLDVDGSSRENWYSPKWAYYAGTWTNTGVDVAFVYEFTKDHGALKWDDFTPTGTFDTNHPYPTDENKMLEAMQTRIQEWHTYAIPSINTPISNNQDSDLDVIKMLLSSGYMLRISTSFDFNEKSLENGESIVIRCYDGGNSSHSMVVVGYDDNICCDVNRDGIIEDGERGAFKLANSHGVNYGNDGFIWVLYDALNDVSSISNDWEDEFFYSYTGERVPVFAMGNNSYNTEIGENYENVSSLNLFNAISIRVKEDYLIAKCSFTDVVFVSTQYSLKNENLNATYVHTPEKLRTAKSGSFVKLDAFPCQVTSTSHEDFFNSKWIVSTTMQYSNSQLRVTLIDNLGNVIGEMSRTSSSSRDYFYDSNFILGDVNYNGILDNDDAQYILSYVANNNNFSKLQKELADYNEDSRINLSDVSAILRAIG